MAYEVPIWLQGGTYPARVDRQLIDRIWTEGFLSAPVVKQRTAGPNMQVEIGPHAVVIQGDDELSQGKYLGVQQTTDLTAALVTPAPGLSMYYRLVARVNDPTAGGNAGNTITVVAVAGNAVASGATPPAVPASAVSIATVGPIVSTTTQITTAMITPTPLQATLSGAVVDGANIADGSITTAKIATAAVTAGALADGAVTSSKIANNAITSAKIADGTITSADLANLAVTTAKIADGAVTTAKIADGNVTSAKIAGGAVTSGAIATGAVTDAKVSGMISGLKIAADHASLSVTGTAWYWRIGTNLAMICLSEATGGQGVVPVAARPSVLRRFPVVRSSDGAIGVARIEPDGNVYAPGNGAWSGSLTYPSY